MSPPSCPVLQQLPRPDGSSPDLHDQLCNIFYGKPYIQCVPNLQHDDLVWFIDYLDKVLGCLDPCGSAFRKCLRELKTICGDKTILPTSYTLPPHLLEIDPEPVASGGSGDVYKGTFNGSEVCIKRVRVRFQSDQPRAAKTFCREAVLWKRLTHPNVLPLLGITVARLQLVSKWVSGGNLLEHILKYPDSDRLGFLSGVAKGLCYLHSCNVIHGDLKGLNILVENGNASLQNCYTPQWAAPEVITEGEYSKEADVFSFAMVMIEVFTGAIPFSGCTPYKAMSSIADGKRPPRPTHPTFTDSLWKLMQHCWEHEPHLRPEISEALEVLLAPEDPAWKRLISRPLVTHERISLIATIFSDQNPVEAVGHLSGDDAQTFIDTIDEALDSLTPKIRRKCLQYLCDVCSHQSLLPTSLPIPLCYNPVETPFYSGKFADVWKGKYDGKGVAAKVLRVGAASDSERVRKRFCKQVIVWKTLHHPNVLSLLGVTMVENLFAIVSEWMPNGNINGYMETHPDANQLELLTDIANGLAYMHDREIAHGDLKGSNILIKNDGRACLAGFRLLTVVPDELTLNLLSDIMERVDSEQWSAPEVLEDGGINKKTDIFSFAMVVIEIFTGKTPFGNMQPIMVALAITQGRRPQRPAHAYITGRLWRIVQRCWNDDPQLRPEASEVLKALLDSNPPPWKRLISPRVPMEEQIDLIKTLFSDRDEVEVFEYLSGGDAQAFVNTIDEVLGGLPPEIRRRCLRSSYRICSRDALLPRSLLIPLCYDPLESPVCSGGLADTWKGMYEGQKVVAKALRIYQTSDLSKIRKWFCKEVVTWKTLRHPNVLPLLGVTMSEGPLRFVMVSEWMENGNIVEFLDRVDADRLKLLGDVTRGLIYMHDWGMVHGNLKGSNIFIDKTGHAVLADFGLIGMIPDQSTFLSTCIDGGTVRWMSPELLDPDKFGLSKSRPTKESDCYALGMVIYEVLGSRTPFGTSSSFTILRKVLEGERPEKPQGDAGKLFIDGIWNVVELCWRAEPSRRATAKDVLAYLEGNPLESDGDDDQSDVESNITD